MRKRKFMSVFAILFVAIFALSVCFFAACKGKKDEEDPTPETEVEDENDDNDDGTESGTGRSGSKLDADDKIIGTWKGDVDIEAYAMGFGGTVKSVMTVEITESSEFELSFVPTAIAVDESLGIDEATVEWALGLAGIKIGESFQMFTGMFVYYDEAGYYADLTGGYIKAQLPLALNANGQLCIDFDEALDFGISVDIKFDAVLDYVDISLYPREDYKVDIANAEDTVAYLTVDENTVFENNANLDIYTEDGINYTVSGTASLMTAGVAAWFGGDEYATEGDPYVVIKVAVAESETISYTSTNGDETIEKSYTNSGEGDSNFDGGYFFIVYKLDIQDGVCLSSKTYTVTPEGGEAVEYTVSFSGVLFEAEVTLTSDPESGEIKAGGSDLTLTADAEWVNGDTYNGSYTWTSSDESVATVEEILSGNALRGYTQTNQATVTPVSEGTATITVTLKGGETATFQVIVKAAPVATSFTITGSEDAALEPGDTLELTANVTMPTEDTDYPIVYTWTSSDESVVTVEAVTERSGLTTVQTNRATVTAVGEGTATITVTLNSGESKTCEMTVDPFTVTAEKGEEITLEGTSFANSNSFTITKTTGDDDAFDYAITGAATIMTAEQISAFNTTYTDDQATDGNAFIVIKILAPAGSSVTFGSKTATAGEDGYAVFVQRLSATDTERVQSVTITYSDNTTVTFTITYSGALIPDDELVGTWSNASIDAKAMSIISATASVELKIDEDGTYSIKISNISADLSSLGLTLDLSDYVVEMKGTWYGGEGTYILTGEEDNSVTVIMNEDGQSVTMSFSMTVYGISVSVTNGTLTSGPLETTTEGGED